MLFGVPWWIFPLGIAFIAFVISEYRSMWKEFRAKLDFKKWEMEVAARNTDGIEENGDKKVQFKGEPKRGAHDAARAKERANQKKFLGSGKNPKTRKRG